MQAIGKKYLIKAERKKQDEDKIGDIYIPQTAGAFQQLDYIGKIIGYGTGFTEEEQKELIPLDTKIMMDWTDKNSVCMHMDQEIYYIINPETIMAIITD